MYWKAKGDRLRKSITSLSSWWLDVRVRLDRQLDRIWKELKDTPLGRSGRVFWEGLTKGGSPLPPAGHPDIKRLVWGEGAVEGEAVT